MKHAAMYFYTGYNDTNSSKADPEPGVCKQKRDISVPKTGPPIPPIPPPTNEPFVTV